MAGFVAVFQWHGIIDSRCRYSVVRRPRTGSRLLPGLEQSKKREKEKNMKKVVICLLFCAAAVMAADKSVFDFALNSIDGQPAPLAAYKGKVVLLVNVASRCGFTPQYAALSPRTRSTRNAASLSWAFPPTISAHRSPGQIRR